MNSKNYSSSLVFLYLSYVDNSIICCLAVVVPFHTLHVVHILIVSYLGLGQPSLQFRLITL